MANGKILRQLFRAGTTGDADAFRLASKAVIEEERQKQHHLLANDLEQILYGGDLNLKASSNTQRVHYEIPIDKERGLPLLDIRTPKRSLDEVILPPDSSAAMEEILEENRRADVLRSYGMKPAGKVIFFGPPGCGKTLAAEVIAFELDKPLAIVRLDALVSSFLGETAANLKKSFRFHCPAFICCFIR